MSEITTLPTASDINIIDRILDRALSGDHLSTADALRLLTQTDPDIIDRIRVTADELRQIQVGDTVTYVINRNINFTNICEQHCSFCAFRRDEGTEGVFWLNTEEILAKAADAVALSATEICMQGGLHPGAKINGRSLTYYVELVTAIKTTFPQLHLHAFSPQEVEFIARQDGLSYADVIIALQQAGVGSMPGTAAEVLDDNRQLRLNFPPGLPNLLSSLSLDNPHLHHSAVASDEISRF